MTTLKIMYRSFDGFERALAAQTADFARMAPGVAFAFEHGGPEELYQRMVAGGGVFDGQADIMLVLTDWLPELIARGGLRPLDAFLAVDPPDDWPHGWSPSMLTLQRDAAGQVYGLPYHDGPEMFHYRADLFADPGEQAAFRAGTGRELRPPVTWDEFLEVARFFTRPEQGQYGVVVAGLNDGHNTVYDFMIQLWSRGGRLLDERGQPAFHDAVGHAALQFYVDLVTTAGVTPPETFALDSLAAGEAYAAGRAAMMLNWAGFMAVAQLPPSRIIDRSRCGPIPRGSGAGGRHASLNVYWVLGICAGSRQPELAWQFLRNTASAAMDRITSLSGGSGVRLSTWNDPAVRAQFQYYETIEEVHRGIDTLPAIPQYPAMNDVLNRMVWRAAQREVSVAQALADAAGDVAAVLARGT